MTYLLGFIALGTMLALVTLGLAASERRSKRIAVRHATGSSIPADRRRNA